MKLKQLTVSICIALFSSGLFAQEKVDQEMISKIKEEGLQNSKVMETLSYISDVYGPRLLGSPGYYEAAQWARSEMAKWGLQNARLDTLDTQLRGWSVESFSVEMVQPRYTRLISYPRAWTASTDGELSGTPMIIEHANSIDSLKAFEGKLRGKILLLGKNRHSQLHFEPFAKRFTADELTGAAQAMVPAPENALGGRTSDKKLSQMLGRWKMFKGKQEAIEQFFLDEGVAAVISPSRSDHGILHVDGTYFSDKGDIKPVPSFIISNEQYGRLVRMIDKGVEPVVKLNLTTKFYTDPRYRANVIAEIPGSDKKLREQLVVVGAHFDSWHSGTGATDNGAGSAVMMEVMRILKAVDAKPRRTVRIVLWTGEEEGLFGSVAYATKYVGDIFTGKTKSEATRISGYFNLDNGSGRIRGIYLQGNERVRPIFEQLLQPFQYLDATTLTVQNTTGTDHLTFDDLNVPAFQFIQDPLNYGSVTHHTNMDVYENAVESDLRQSATIIASIVYHVAMRDQMLPREPVRKPDVKKQPTLTTAR